MNTMLMWIIAVMSGGALGALVRYLTTLMLAPIYSSSGLPLATLVVNVVGCFVLSWFVHAAPPVPVWVKLAATTGFLGSLTTFSTFKVETHGLVSVPMGLQSWQFHVYYLGNLLLGYGAVLWGAWLGRS